MTTSLPSLRRLVCYNCRYHNRRFLTLLSSPVEEFIDSDGICEMCGKECDCRYPVEPRNGMPWPDALAQQPPDELRPDRCPHCQSFRTTVHSHNTGHFMEGLYVSFQCIDCQTLFTLQVHVEQILLYGGKGRFVTSIGPWPPPSPEGDTTRKIRLEV